MKIDCISDTHCQIDLTTLEYSDAEILIIAGDIGNMSTPLEVKVVFEEVDSLPHKHIVFVPGNHDAYFDIWYVPFETRAHLLINDIVEIDGIRIGGSPYTPEFCGWFFMRPDEELAEIWNIFKDQNLDILVTHGPPKDILDSYVQWDDEVKCGSQTLLDALPKIAPKAHIFGHIHECHGHKKQDGIDFYNVAICDRVYEAINPVTTIEI